MEQEPIQPESEERFAYYVWVLALSIGLAIGAGIGVVIGSIGAGVGIGVGVGVTVGLVLSRRYMSKSRDD
jgi:hypothetical protein